MNSELINTVSVETHYGFRDVNLYYGDITTATDEVLVLSSHANARIPLAGQVIDRLKEKYGFKFERLAPLLLLRGVEGTHRVVEHLTTPYKEILVVRISGGGGQRQQNVPPKLNTPPLSGYEQAIWTVYGSLAALELQGQRFGSVALPLLGGRRGIHHQKAMRINLDYAAEWLKTSRFMQAVNFYVYEPDQVVLWQEAMNTALRRQFVKTANKHVVQGLSAEIVAIASTPIFQTKRLKEALEPIVKALNSDTLCLQLVATFGRVATEVIVKEVCQSQGIATNLSLFKAINTLDEQKIVAPWLINHFHNIRILGNETVHTGKPVTYRPDELGEDDLIPILASLLRVLSFWQSWHTTLPGSQ